MSKKSTLFVFLTLPIAIPMNFFINSKIGNKIGKKLPYWPRFINWIWASWGGLFWLSCPICKKNFGGHEWNESIMFSKYSGSGVCPKCSGIAKERNKKFFKEIDMLY